MPDSGNPFLSFFDPSPVVQVEPLGGNPFVDFFGLQSPESSPGSESEWEDLGIFERNKVTGETRLKDKPGQLGGIGGELTASSEDLSLAKDVTIPDSAQAPDFRTSYQDLGMTPGMGLPGLLVSPETVDKIPIIGEYANELNKAGLGGTLMGARAIPALVGTASRVGEWATTGLMEATGAPESMVERWGQAFDNVNAGINAADQYIEQGRKFLLDPDSKGSEAGDAIDSLKTLWNEPSWSHAAELAHDVPLAVTEQVAQMGTMFFTGGGLKAATGTAGALTGAKMIAKNIGAGMGAQIGTETYNELADAGVNPLIAGPVAVASGVVQSYLESWGAMEMLGGKFIGEKILSKMNAGLVSRTLVRAFTSALTEGGEEAAQQVVDNIAKGLPPNWDKLPEKSVKELFSKATNGAWDSFLGGAIVGFPLGGMTGLGGVEAPEKPKPTQTPEKVLGVAGGGVVTLDQETKDYIAGGKVEDLSGTPGEVAAAGAIGNRIAEDTAIRDDGNLPSLLDNIEKEIFAAQQDPNLVTRNRTAKAISNRIEEILALIEAGEANGIPAEKMGSLFNALDSLSTFSKARSKWAETVRKRLFDAAEAQAKANSVQVTNEQVEAVGKALQTTVQKAGDSAKQQVLQVGQRVGAVLQALQPIDPVQLQESGMDPASIEQLQLAQEDQRALAEQALVKLKKDLADGELAWVRLDPHLIENLDQVDWEYVADSVSHQAREMSSTTVAPLVDSLEKTTPSTVMSRVADKVRTTAAATKATLAQIFPSLFSGNDQDVVQEVRRIFTEMAQGHKPDSKIGYLAALSQQFGLQSHSLNKQSKQFTESIVRPQGVVPQVNEAVNLMTAEIVKTLRHRGFSQSTVENSDLMAEITWIARTLVNERLTGRTLVTHSSNYVQSATRVAGMLLSLEPEAAKVYNEELAQQYADAVLGQVRSDVKRLGIDPRSYTHYTASEVLQDAREDPSDALAIGTLALDRLLSDGTRGVDALVALSRVKGVSETTGDTLDNYIYRTLTGREPVSQAVAKKVRENVVAGLAMVPGPHSIAKNISDASPGVKVATLAAVDAMADVWMKAGSVRAKSEFYSRLTDRMLYVDSDDPIRGGGYVSWAHGKDTQQKDIERRVELGKYEQFGKSMIYLAKSSTGQIRPVAMLHEVMHALDRSGLLEEMQIGLGSSKTTNFGLPADLQGKTHGSASENLSVGFEIFLQTRAAPNEKMAPLFHLVKAYLSGVAGRMMDMSTEALQSLEQHADDVPGYGIKRHPDTLPVDFVRKLYMLLNAGHVPEEALESLGPANFAAATVEEAIQQASDGKRSIMPALIDRAEQIREDVESLIGDQDVAVVFGSEVKNDSPNNQVGGTKNLANPDIKEHVEQKQKEYEATNPMFTAVEKKKKKKTGRPKRSKKKGGRRRTRLKKPSVKKAQAIIDKIANMEDEGRFNGEEASIVKAGAEALDMVHDSLIQSDKEADTPRQLTWKNFPDVFGEKLVNWFRMMTTRFHSKDSRQQRIFDENGLSKTAMHLQNLAGLANRAGKIIHLPVTVYDRESSEFVPVPTETPTLRNIFHTFEEILRPFSEVSKISMDDILKHFVIYLSATRQDEVFQNGLARLRAWQAAMDKWEKSGKKGVQPEKPNIVLSPEWQTASELSLQMLRIVYGDENMKIFDTFSEQITRWGRAAILDKLLHVGMITKEEYDAMVKAGKRWVPFARLNEFVDDEMIPYEFRSDGSTMDPVKFLTMDIGGGIRNPLTELARRAAAVDMLTSRQSVKNDLGDLLMSLPNPHKAEGGAQVLHKRVVVSKAVWDATPEEMRSKPRNKKLSEEEQAKVAEADPSIRTKKEYGIYVPITKEDYGKARLKGKIRGHVVAAWNNGVPTYIHITDRDLAQAYIEMNPVQSSGWHKFLNGIGYLTRQFVGRPLVTTVSFMYNGPWRDLFSAVPRSQHGMLPLVDWAIGMYQSMGVLFPTLSELYPEHFAAAKAYNEGLGGMSTMQAQMHEAAYAELANIFKHGKRIRQPKTVTGGVGSHAKAIFSAVLGDLTDRLTERGVVLSPSGTIFDTSGATGIKNKLAKAGQDWKKTSTRAKVHRAGSALMIPWNGFLFLPEMVTEVMELSFRLGEGRLTMAEAVHDPRLVGYYSARNANFKKGDRVGYTGMYNRLKWIANKEKIIRNLNDDPTYVPPENAMPVYFSSTERDNAIRNVTLDFGNRGRYLSNAGNPAIFDGTALSKLYVFWNPMMQDAYSSMKLMRPAMEWAYNKASAKVSGWMGETNVPYKQVPPHLAKKGLAFMTKMFALTTIPAMAQILMHWDDDHWWSKSYLERIAYIHLWKNSKGQFVKVPAGLSFATLLFRDLPMSAMMQGAEKDPQAVSKFLDRFFDQMPFGLPFRTAKATADGGARQGAKQLLYDLAPSFVVQPAVSWAMNYNGFFGSEIVRPQMYEETLDSERDADRFGYMQNKLARWMQVTPAEADYIIRRGFPGAVNNPIAPVNVANFLAKQTNMGGEEMGANIGTSMTYGGNMTPWLSREEWGPSNEWVRDFTKLYKETLKARNSYEDYRDRGVEKRANELYKEYELIQDQNWERLEYVNNTIRDFYQIRKEIMGDPGLTPDEKELLVKVNADMPMSLFAMEEMRGILNYASEVK